MGDCLYSSYSVPEGNFRLNRDKISYLGGKMRGPENIYWQCKTLKLDRIHVEAYQKFVIAADNINCNYVTIKAKHIYVPEGVSLSGCTLIGAVHSMPLDDIRAMLELEY